MVTIHRRERETSTEDFVALGDDCLGNEGVDDALEHGNIELSDGSVLNENNYIKLLMRRINVLPN